MQQAYNFHMQMKEQFARKAKLFVDEIVAPKLRLANFHFSSRLATIQSTVRLATFPLFPQRYVFCSFSTRLAIPLLSVRFAPRILTRLATHLFFSRLVNPCYITRYHILSPSRFVAVSIAIASPLCVIVCCFMLSNGI